MDATCLAAAATASECLDGSSANRASMGRVFPYVLLDTDAWDREPYNDAWDRVHESVTQCTNFYHIRVLPRKG